MGFDYSQGFKLMGAGLFVTCTSIGIYYVLNLLDFFGKYMFITTGILGAIVFILSFALIILAFTDSIMDKIEVKLRKHKRIKETNKYEN